MPQHDNEYKAANGLKAGEGSEGWKSLELKAGSHLSLAQQCMRVLKA